LNTLRIPEVAAVAGIWLLSCGASWPADHVRGEGHLAAPIEHLAATLSGNYRYQGAPLEWKLEQSFQMGSTQCSGETLQHEVLLRPTLGEEKFWDRHVRRRFDFSDVTMIAVRPGLRPLIYTLPGEPATLEPEEPSAFTITISTSGMDFEIEFHGFDGGDPVPAEAPLHFKSYYHDLFVSTHSNAIGAAAYLRALAAACGSVPVQMYD